MKKAHHNSSVVCLTILVGISFLLTPESDGQESEKPLTRFVRRMHQDNRGHLWFGTNGDGVIRYDGEDVEFFSLEEGFGGVAVRGIVEDKSGNVWFGTERGLTKYDGKSFTNFSSKDGLPHDDVWALTIDRSGIIWVGTLQGASRFDGMSFSDVELPEGKPDPLRGVTSARIVHCIMQDSKGAMWFGTNVGAFRHDGQSLTNLSEKDGLCNNAVNCILEDNNGSFWFATHHNGVCRWDGKKFKHFTSKDGVEGFEAWDLYKDSSGNIWFPIENHGVYRYDGKTFANFGKKQGLTSNAIQCAFEDKQGRVWLGGWQGLFRIEGESIVPVGKDGPWPKLSVSANETRVNSSDNGRIAQYVVEVFEDRKGKLWFGTVSRGVARFDGRKLNYFTTEDGLPSNTVSSLAEDRNGNLWAGTHAGVCKFNGSRFTKINVSDDEATRSDPSPEAWSGVGADNEGNLWASVGRRLYRYDGAAFAEFKLPIRKDKISSYAILAGDATFHMQDKAGNRWFSSDGYGVFVHDGNSFARFSTDDGLCSNNVTSIMEDREGRIWFTCMQSFQPKMTGDGGLCRYDGKSMTRFADVKGLDGADLYTIKETKSGDIWIGATGLGLYRYDGLSFRLINKSDKPEWLRNFGTQTILEDRNGTLWFGMSGGLFRFNGKSLFHVSQSGLAN